MFELKKKQLKNLKQTVNPQPFKPSSNQHQICPDINT